MFSLRHFLKINISCHICGEWGWFVTLVYKSYYFYFYYLLFLFGCFGVWECGWFVVLIYQYTKFFFYCISNGHADYWCWCITILMDWFWLVFCGAAGWYCWWGVASIILVFYGCVCVVLVCGVIVGQHIIYNSTAQSPNLWTLVRHIIYEHFSS